MPLTTFSRPEKSLVSIVIPAFNEEIIIERNIGLLYDYLETIVDDYRWEIIIVNDGSSDNTGALADSLAQKHDNLKVYHHITNRNLGTAMRTGFKNTNGDYVVVLDIDLSYAPEHIGRLLN